METKSARRPSCVCEMKPVQVGILMAVAALGGGLFVKWQSTRQPILPPPAIKPVVAAPPVQPPPKPEAAAASVPLPVGDESRHPDVVAKPRKRPRHTEPVLSARQAPVTPLVKPAPAPEIPAPPTPDPPALTEAQPPTPEAIAPPPPPARQVTLKAGMLIPVRTSDLLSSDRNQPGDTFSGTLDQPLVADGYVIAERGSRVQGRIVRAERGGRTGGRSTMAIELVQVRTSDGQRVRIETDPFEKRGNSSAGEDAAKIGAGAGLGAIIGAVAGGGKGAGIGAAVGGAAGTGGVLLTHGKAAVLRPETRIDFRLRSPVTITEQAPSQE